VVVAGAAAIAAGTAVAVVDAAVAADAEATVVAAVAAAIAAVTAVATARLFSVRFLPNFAGAENSRASNGHRELLCLAVSPFGFHAIAARS
jgi:hypothetical protein